LAYAQIIDFNTNSAPRMQDSAATFTGMLTMDTPFAMYDALSSIDVPPEKVRVVVQSMEHDMALFATSSQFNQLDRYSGSRFDLLQAEIAELRNTMIGGFELVEGRFKQLRHELIAQLGTMIADAVAVLGALMAWLR
jgi:hypothetical protein